MAQTKGGQEMPRGKKFTAEQIIGKLREAEVGLAQGKTVPEVVRKLGLTSPQRPVVAQAQARGGHGWPRGREASA